MAKIRVLIADDHTIVRTGLRTLINSQPDMELCAEAADAREAIGKATEVAPDIAVIDLTMPGGGITALEAIRQRCPSVRLLVLTMHHDPAFVRTALAAGASGYVTKGSVDTDLLSGIRAIYQGQRFIDPSVAAELIQRTLNPALAGAGSAIDRLSDRERQALELLAQGYTNQQVADRLFIGVKTAETYRARIGKKLGLHQRSDFVRYGVETGLLGRGPLTDA